MSENPEEKPCRKCGEAILIAAQRCPKCQSWQSAWAQLKANPGIWFSFPFILFSFVPLYYLSPLGKADFEKHRSQIQLVDSQLNVEGGAGLEKIVTLGQLRNNSSVKWNHVVIEVQYFDNQNQLIGTETDEKYDLVLLPGQQHAFEVQYSPAFPVGKVASQKIFIRDARDASGWLP